MRNGLLRHTLIFLLGLPGSGLAASESDKANAFFERAYQETIARSPLWQAQLGLKEAQDRWPDLSDAGADQELARSLQSLAELKRTVDVDALDAETRRSYRLFAYDVEWKVRGHLFRFYNYPVSHNRGLQSTLPGVLTGQHRIDTLEDARAYVMRLRGFAALFQQLVDGLEVRRREGVVPPRWAFEPVTRSLEFSLTGEPLDQSGRPHELWADFTAKLGRLKGLSDEQRTALREAARSAIRQEVRAGYEQLLAAWRRLETEADDRDGVWKFPRGDAYYAHLVAETTTTSLTPDEVHRIGLDEIRRIHTEMRALLPRVGFEGDLKAFFAFVRDDPRFFLPDTAEGREEYVRRATAILDDMQIRLPELFGLNTRAPWVVRPIPADRAAGAGFASYSRGTRDGSRPGVFNVNLSDMRQMPVYQIRALAYHEAIPGHHLQMSVAQELDRLPAFRRIARYPAYLEGWGLYAEDLTKELGLYADPYEDFGRLSLQLLRAVRLVADTGIHAKRWSRRQAVEYMLAQTAMSEADALRETGRYITNPTQAIAYTIGHLRIMQIRDRARRELGSRFDVRAFHDVVLGQGQVPLDVLEEAVADWIAEVRGK